MSRRKYTVKVNMPNLSKGEAMHVTLRSYPERDEDTGVQLDPTEESYNFENGGEYVIDLPAELAAQLRDAYGFTVKAASKEDAKILEEEVEKQKEAEAAEAAKDQADKEAAEAADAANAGGEGGDS